MTTKTPEEIRLNSRIQANRPGRCKTPGAIFRSEWDGWHHTFRFSISHFPAEVLKELKPEDMKALEDALHDAAEEVMSKWEPWKGRRRAP